MGDELGKSKCNQDATQIKSLVHVISGTDIKKTNKYKNIQRDMVSALYIYIYIYVKETKQKFNLCDHEILLKNENLNPVFTAVQTRNCRFSSKKEARHHDRDLEIPRFPCRKNDNRVPHKSPMSLTGLRPSKQIRDNKREKASATAQ
ncbi:hypothetical protein fugu_001886 [Takifugu bimaculatus]|uniref:Uncharacterized protein n=1 Tax=Takifugu bimaculatus TaxID=433685 RepID=A0A4Z2BQZ3_9TELE|nr:hypothetical protein fugu_001886 [Takifugu bimaculatus]